MDNNIVPLENPDETSALVDDVYPKREAEELQRALKEFWSGTFDKDVVKNIAVNLRNIEAKVCKRYESRCPPELKKQMDIGDMKETLDCIEELEGNFVWIFRFPSLILTVLIASVCIPLATALDSVIEEHPILGGFPPAISAAAGCIGIQNTAIIIRAIGTKLIKTSKLQLFLRYAMISCALALGAAFIEMFVAWIVISVDSASGATEGSWTVEKLYKDVPVVIFFAMFVTGSLAGCIGAGVPLLVTWISEKIQKHADPAHWVGPIETVTQELSATMLTFWIADTFVFPKSVPLQ